MIPKIIHYCWFGRNPLPKLAVKCIASWRKFFPEYEIREWNEDSFNVNIIPYTRDAYSDRKFAFVSDYARFWILYHHGGIYFDTDVEVIGHMDDIISRGPFMGLEVSGERFSVNPGLGLATDVGNPVYKSILESYSTLPYSLYDGSRNPYTMIPLVSDLFRGKGLTGKMEIQTVDGISVYAPDFFNPLDDATGRLLKTSNTRSIHWYMKSWMPEETPLKVWSKRLMRRLFGKTTVSRLRSLFNK